LEQSFVLEEKIKVIHQKEPNPIGSFFCNKIIVFKKSLRYFVSLPLCADL
jgi:hypothetical protein